MVGQKGRYCNLEAGRRGDKKGHSLKRAYNEKKMCGGIFWSKKGPDRSMRQGETNREDEHGIDDPPLRRENLLGEPSRPVTSDFSNCPVAPYRTLSGVLRALRPRCLDIPFPPQTDLKGAIHARYAGRPWHRLADNGRAWGESIRPCSTADRPPQFRARPCLRTARNGR